MDIVLKERIKCLLQKRDRYVSFLEQAFLPCVTLPLKRQTCADFADGQLLMDSGAGGEIDAVAGVEIGDTERFKIVDGGGELGRDAEEVEAADDA